MPADNVQRDPLLITMLTDLTGSVNDMREKLHRAMVDNTKQLAAVESKLSAATAPLDTRISALERDQGSFKDEVKREARKWGAIGGVGAAVTAVLSAVVAVFTGHSK